MGDRTRIVALPTGDDTIFAELPTPSLRLAVLGPLRSGMDNSGMVSVDTSLLKVNPEL